MKTIKLLMLLCVALVMSFTTKYAVKTTAPNGKTMSIAWKQTEVNLGEITQNKPVTVEFEFTNTGEMPVIISSAKASCGCTSADFSHSPILPGEKGKVSAVYNAASAGSFKKTVSVTTNAEEGDKILTLTGNVVQATAPKEAGSQM